MILPDWLNLWTLVRNGRNFRRILGWVALLTVYSAVIAWLDQLYGGELVHVNAGFHSLLGLVLGLLLVFRTNTAYDRWWEGRKLWGQLVNDSRNFAIKIQTCVDAPQREKDLVAKRLTTFATALKWHLRGDFDSLRKLTSSSAAPDELPHLPMQFAQLIYEQIEHWRRADQVGGFELLFLDRHAAALMDICGGCERIRKTPIAASYRTFIRQSIAIYLATLPWGVIDLMGWWTPAVVALAGYFMIGVEVLAEDVEEPFGTDDDDLDLDGICTTIERSIREIVR